MAEYPEHDKLSQPANVHKIVDLSHQLGFFLDWLEEQGIQLGEYKALLDPPTLYTVIECPDHKRWKTGPCWRVEGSGISLSHKHYTDEEEAHEVAATKEDKRLADAQANPVFQPVYGTKERLLARYFDVDLDEIEKEKQAMLDKLRGQQS